MLRGEIVDENNKDEEEKEDGDDNPQDTSI